MPRSSVLAVQSSLPGCGRALLGGVRFEHREPTPPVRGTPTPVKRLLEPPPSYLTAKLAAERKFQRLNHCAQQHQPQPALSAPTKSLCREGLREYAPLHAPIVHRMRPCGYHDRRRWPKPLVGDAAQAAGQRNARRAQGTRARPSAGAAGQFANTAVPCDSVSATPPHGATVASLETAELGAQAADFADEGRYV